MYQVYLPNKYVSISGCFPSYSIVCCSVDDCIEILKAAVHVLDACQNEPPRSEGYALDGPPPYLFTTRWSVQAFTTLLSVPLKRYPETSCFLRALRIRVLASFSAYGLMRSPSCSYI